MTMSMPVVDSTEDALIEEQIARELQLIEVEDDDDDDDEDEIKVSSNSEQGGLDDEQPFHSDQTLPECLQVYINRIQDQSKLFESHLDECDELIHYTDKKYNDRDAVNIDEGVLSLLEETAKLQGMNPQALTQKILEELEASCGDDLELEDQNPELEDRHETVQSGTMSAMGCNEQGNAADQFVDTSSMQYFLKTQWIDFQKRQDARQLQEHQEHEKEHVDEAKWRRTREDIHLQRHQQMEKEAIERAQHRRIEQAKEEAEAIQRQLEIQEELKIIQDSLKALEETTKVEQKLFVEQKIKEDERRAQQQSMAALKIQRHYRGYRERKQYLETLKDKRQQRKKRREEMRILELEVEIKQREAEKQKSLRKKEEDEKEQRKLEEEQQKKLEEQLMEENKLKIENQKKELEEKQKQEDVENMIKEEKRKEEVRVEEKKRQKEQEEKQREEQRTKDDDQKRKEEELSKNEDEMIMREKEEKSRRDAEEKQRISEENMRIEEQNRQEMENKENYKPKVQEDRDILMNMEQKHMCGTIVVDENKVVKDCVNDEANLNSNSESVDDKYSLLTKDLPNHLEKMRLDWMQNCLPWSKISTEPWKQRVATAKRLPRCPSAAKKLPPFPGQLILNGAHVSALNQVTTVQLQDLPGYSMSSIGQCHRLTELVIHSCDLRALDGLSQCSDMRYLDVQHNKLSYIDLHDLNKLEYVNLSHNAMTGLHGFRGCSNIRWLDMSHNKITHIDSLDGLRKLHTLILSYNQLISAERLGQCPTLQSIDLSYNHLQTVGELDKLCLLQRLVLSSNNLLEVPSLENHVLLYELLLDDNSLSDLEPLSQAWLPSLTHLQLAQNSICSLPNMESFLSLKHLNAADNQLSDLQALVASLHHCHNLQHVRLAGNPVMAEPSYRAALNNAFQLLLTLDGTDVHETIVCGATQLVQPQTSFEAMCLIQTKAVSDMTSKFQHNLALALTQTPSVICPVYFTYCDKMYSLAIEYRASHEYGNISPNLPVCPTTPRTKSASLASQRYVKIHGSDNNNDRYDKISEKITNKTDDISANANRVSNAKTVVNKTMETADMKQKFDAALMSRGCINICETNKNIEEMNDNSCQLHMDHTPSVEMDRLGKISTIDYTGTSDNRDSDGTDLNRYATVIQSLWRGYCVRRDLDYHTRVWLAVTMIQSVWRGYSVRKQLRRNKIENLGSTEEHLAAKKIQALWRGFCLRLRLEQALLYARGADFDEDDDQMSDYGEINLAEFDFDETRLEDDWKPSDMPEIPSSHPTLGKPPTGHRRTHPSSDILTPLQPHPPSFPKHAWRSIASPMSDRGRIRQQSGSTYSVISDEMTDTYRTTLSKKEEAIQQEWGFKDVHTAELMFQRARKMKYNAEHKRKIGKLDPKQRLALFRKLEESSRIHPVSQPSLRTMPRKEYFKARAEEAHKQTDHQDQAVRTFEWLHTQVGEYSVTDSKINEHMNHSSLKHVYSEMSLPHLDPDILSGGRVQLMRSPASMDVESVSSMGQDRSSRLPRRYSMEDMAKKANATVPLPTVKISSAPSNRKKEKISWRPPVTEKEIGWGGGRKRSGNR